MVKRPSQEAHRIQALVPLLIRIALILLTTTALVFGILAWQSGQQIGTAYQGQGLPEEDDPDTPGEMEPIVEPEVLPVHQAELAR